MNARRRGLSRDRFCYRDPHIAKNPFCVASEIIPQSNGAQCLATTDGDQIDENMDAVAYLQEFKDHTGIHFVGGLSAEGRARIVGVREKPDTIHLANPLHAA